jgi:hypothetical protein
MNTTASLPRSGIPKLAVEFIPRVHHPTYVLRHVVTPATSVTSPQHTFATTLTMTLPLLGALGERARVRGSVSALAISNKPFASPALFYFTR